MLISDLEKIVKIVQSSSHTSPIFSVKNASDNTSLEDPWSDLFRMRLFYTVVYLTKEIISEQK